MRLRRRGCQILTGGLGIDAFLYGRLPSSSNPINSGVDEITDFTRGTDGIILYETTFRVSPDPLFGFIQPEEFASVSNNAAAAASNALIVFSRATSTLFYNSNQSSPGFGTAANSGAFATLPGVANFGSEDILVASDS